MENFFAEMTAVLKATATWFEILKIIAALTTAIVAIAALQNWKKQARAGKHTEFLEELTDSVHECLHHLGAAIQIVRFVKISVECSGVGTPLNVQVNGKDVAFIEKSGSEYGKRLAESLKPSIPIVSKIESLIAKGQIFGLNNYSKCQNSCRKIVEIHETFEWFNIILQSQNLNWSHPEVQKALSKWNAINVEDLSKQLQEENVKLLEFAEENYRKAHK